MKIIDNLDSAAWNSVLKDFNPVCRCYFTAGYHNLHVANGDGAARCSLLQSAKKAMLIVGIQMLIPAMLTGGQVLYDIQSCNGYGGPLGSAGFDDDNDDDDDFLEEAWGLWKHRCRENGIVAAMFRPHPLLHNERLLPRDARVITDRKTVYVDVSGGGDAILAKANSQYRNMLNKAKREGAKVDWNEPAAWAEVPAFYAEAMERLHAPPHLRFSSAYFEALRQLPCMELASIRRNGQLTAFSIFLFGATYSHYHLSARNADAANYSHTVILHEALVETHRRGLRGTHLGGGRTPAPDDTLLRFKRSTGGELLDFKLGLVISDEEKNQNLCHQWEAAEGRPPEWLLGYRQPRTTGFTTT